MVLFILSLILVLITTLSVINPVKKINVPILYTINEYHFRHGTKDHKQSEYEKIYKTDKGVVIDTVFPAIVYGEDLAHFGINDGDKVLVKKENSMWGISRATSLMVIKKQDVYIILTHSQYVSSGIKDVELIGIAKWKYKKSTETC